MLIANDRYQVMPGDPARRSVKVIVRATGKVLFVHPVPHHGYELTYSGLYRDRLVMVDDDVLSPNTMTPDSPAKPPEVTVYNLSTGRRTRIEAILGAPTPSLYVSQGYVDASGRFLYGAQSKGGFADCVGQIDLVAMRGRTVTCVPKPAGIFWLGSASTGVTWTGIKLKGDKQCRFSGWLDGDTVRPMSGTSECGSFDNAVLDGWQIWSEQDLDVIKPEIPLTASDGTQKIDLGMISPQTLQVCGSYAYWRVTKDGEPDSIVRWKPGSPIHTVYTAETEGKSSYDDVILFPDGCSDSHLTVSVTRLVGTSTVKLLYVDSR
ncbi:hypothetical protein GCM10010168_21890 [Actinoplanes ianthinogenes]|uniref:Uncharacterized protein n=2 Tax=Actinoplanes ianthinogenes TaxID=122358 RepID=A0ABM7M840_9ACTN|nr:hypothetical protein Aiant_84870 [Actinoplanes ianthinogenes]GGR04463.1 hypothetical protein GCM10010168_21890 [Actinoplanes ianthinogenes]